MTKPRVQPGAKGSRDKGPRSSSLDSTIATRESEIVVVRAKTKRTLAKWQVFTILRRLAAVVAVIQYAYVSLSASWWSFELLSGAPNPTETLRVFPASLIQGYLGDGLIRDSPLVQDVLAGDVAPRDYLYILYLESDKKASTDQCSKVPLFNSEIYNFKFLSKGYQGIVDSTKYNITALAEMELVVIVVDCTFRQIILGDPSVVRIFSLVRSRENPNDFGGLLLWGMITLVQDMRADEVDQFYMVATTYPYQRSPDFEMYELVGVTDESYLELRSIPRDPLVEPVKNLITARKRGFYEGDSQANVRVMYSILEGLNAKTALTRWEWIGEAVTIDSWAWVHWIHLFFALQTVYLLIVLFLLTYQKFRSGKVWIGDPFASLSTTSLVIRGILVIISWCLDSFWSVNKYAMPRGAMITGSQVVRIHKEVMHADIMVVFLSLVRFLSSIFRERIDPAIAIFLFEFIHRYRLTLIRSCSAVLNEVEIYSETQWKIGIAHVTPVIRVMSPMRLWSSFEIPAKDPTLLFASFFPTIQRSSQSNDASGNERSETVLRGIFTNFEIATGAELETRYGIITDYNNYVYFKGMKFASPDGVYCSGYVVVNSKSLVATKDLLSIIIMKAMGSRLRNVDAYAVEGNSVRDTARLVNPTTYLWSDLWRLNVTVLF